MEHNHGWFPQEYHSLVTALTLMLDDTYQIIGQPTRDIPQYPMIHLYLIMSYALLQNNLEKLLKKAQSEVCQTYL